MGEVTILAVNEPTLSSPAYCNRLTGTVYLNSPKYQALPDDNIRLFVKLHEIGHVMRQRGKYIDMKDPRQVLQSELEADAYAFDSYAHQKKPLHKCIQALTRVLKYDKNRDMDITRTLALLKRAAEYDLNFNDNREAKKILAYINSISPPMKKATIYEYDNGLALSNRPKGWAKDKFWSAADGTDMALDVVSAAADITSNSTNNQWAQLAAGLVKAGANIGKSINKAKQSGLGAAKDAIDSAVKETQAAVEAADLNNQANVNKLLGILADTQKNFPAGLKSDAIAYIVEQFKPLWQKVSAANTANAGKLPGLKKNWERALQNLAANQNEANLSAARTALQQYITASAIPETTLAASAEVLVPGYDVGKGPANVVTGRGASNLDATARAKYADLRALIGPVQPIDNSKAVGDPADVVVGGSSETVTGRSGESKKSMSTTVKIIIAAVIVVALILVWYFFIRKK